MRAVAAVQIWIQSLVGLGLLLAAGYLGYRLVRADLTAQVYRDRLSTLASDYESLRGRYNEAVARTAVTELVVAEGKLSVSVRTADGGVREIPTPFDPSREIYVDYAVIDGRLWIRRVFDQNTPPERGLVIDPKLAGVDWEAADAGSGADRPRPHGKAVYRTLSEGRWAVSVSGDGSLTLAPAPRRAELAHAPEIRTHEALAEEARREAEAINARDVWRYVVGG